jgi:hypothetical protein
MGYMVNTFHESNMKRILLTAALGLAMAAPAYATEAVWNLSKPSGLLGNSQSYAADGFSITASGFTGTGTWNGTALFGKTAGGDETGLGIASDPSGNDEIWGMNFIQIDVTQAVALGVTNFQFAMGSTTQGEQWSVYGSNTTGVGTNFGTWTSIITGGTDEGALHDLTGDFNYYDFLYTGGPPGDQWPGFSCGAGCNANVLLTQFQGLEPTGTVTGGAREPSTWAMGLIGFGVMAGLAAFNRRKASRYIEV